MIESEVLNQIELILSNEEIFIGGAFAERAFSGKDGDLIIVLKTGESFILSIKRIQ